MWFKDFDNDDLRADLRIRDGIGTGGQERDLAVAGGNDDGDSWYTLTCMYQYDYSGSPDALYWSLTARAFNHTIELHDIRLQATVFHNAT